MPQSDGRYGGFAVPAVSAIIDSPIKAGVQRFGTGIYQRLAAPGAGRPKLVNKRKIKRGKHSKISERLFDRNTQSIPHSDVSPSFRAGYAAGMPLIFHNERFSVGVEAMVPEIEQPAVDRDAGYLGARTGRRTLAALALTEHWCS